MNILRVWGGGVFLPDVWYDSCDVEGVLVYHDMQFAQQVRPSLGACPSAVKCTRECAIGGSVMIAWCACCARKPCMFWEQYVCAQDSHCV